MTSRFSQNTLTVKMLVEDLAVLSKALELLPMGVTITDPEGTILFVNTADAAMHGYEREELIGKNVRVFSTSRHWKILSIDELKTLRYWKRESINRKKDRTLFPVQLISDIVVGGKGEVIGLITICEDLTQRKVLDDLRREEEGRIKKLEFDALHDALTGLTNRVLFLDRLSVAFNRWRRRKDTCFAVFLLDLDNFKQINDNYGHFAGDQVLIEVTQRLKECLRPADTLARLGGDEFGVLLDDLARSEDAILVARRLQSAIMRPTTVQQNTEVVTASIGIALPSRTSINAEDLLNRADLAMYEAKKKGKNQFVVSATSASDAGGASHEPQPRTPTPNLVKSPKKK